MPWLLPATKILSSHSPVHASTLVERDRLRSPAGCNFDRPGACVTVFAGLEIAVRKGQGPDAFGLAVLLAFALALWPCGCAGLSSARSRPALNSLPRSKRRICCITSANCILSPISPRSVSSTAIRNSATSSSIGTVQSGVALRPSKWLANASRRWPTQNPGPPSSLTSASASLASGSVR